MLYDRLVSLGPYCEPAAQIKRYTGTETACLFDWVSTASWDGLIKCFETDFADFFRLENLRAHNNNVSVIDLATDFVFPHHFGEEGNRTIFPGVIERDYRRIRQLLLLQIRYFKEILDTEHILLIRQGSARNETILRLIAAIEQAHPGARFDLLLVNKQGQRTTLDHPGIRIDLGAYSKQWSGDDESWDGIFARHAPENGRKKENSAMPVNGSAHWIAKCDTNIKRSTRYAFEHSADDMIKARLGAVLTAEVLEPHRGHHKLLGATVNGCPIEDGWFIYPAHWDCHPANG